MDQLRDEILEMEWDMFSRVNDGHPKASCQEDKGLYIALRDCQLSVWNRDVQESYLEDLKEALSQGRNLMTEKYAYMMSFTDPEYFAAIRHLLPEVSDAKQILADRITEIQTQEYAEAAERYGKLVTLARNVGSASDEAGNVSAETYSRCELWTWSEKTLGLFFLQIEEMHEKGENYVLAVLDNSAKVYGFSGLDDMAQARSRA